MTSNGGFKEYPQYTRPEVFITRSGEKWKVPPVLISGHQKKFKIGKKKEARLLKNKDYFAII